VVTVVLFNIFTSVLTNIYQANVNQAFSQVQIKIVTAAGDWLLVVMVGGSDNDNDGVG
jgi:hypothetical protein